MDVAGHDAYLGLPRRDDPRAVGADEAAARILQRGHHPDHVQGGDALGDAHRHLDPRGGGLQNGVRGKGRGHEDQGSVGPRVGHRLGHGVEHRDLVHLLAAFARGHPRHHLGAVFGAGPGMKRAFLAGYPLYYHPCIVIYQNAHISPFTRIISF